MNQPTIREVSIKTGRNFFLGGCKCAGRKKPRKRGKCRSIVTNDIVQKPDLAIYSQTERLNKGMVPTWDSPDIVTNHWGPFRLMEEAKVKIRNLSSSVPAINTHVHYLVSPFGIGTKKEHKLTKIINVPPSGEIDLLFPLDQMTFGGDPRVGVHIQIEHPHDPNQLNNIGSQVHDGGFTSESGRTFTVQVPIYNDSNFSRQINLSTMPTDIIASVNPTSHTFMAHEQLIATLNIQIPDTMHGTPASYLNKSVTLVGRLLGGELIGGVTRLIRINN